MIRTHCAVMAGHSPPKDGRLSTPYVPAIHAAPLRITFGIEPRGSAWMPGTRPGMTSVGCKSQKNYNHARRTGQRWDKPGHDGEDAR
jgi:hypothetical protein